MVVTFDLFGTLVRRRTDVDSAQLLAKEFFARGIDLPMDWGRAYGTSRTDRSSAREQPLPRHVDGVLRRGGIAVPIAEIRSVCVHAFERAVEPIPHADETVESVAGQEPIGLLSNCSVPGLIERVIERSTIPEEEFSAIVSSVDSGWRKPHPNAFETIATLLGTTTRRCIHVGDDPVEDGGIATLGGRVVIVDETRPIRTVPGRLEQMQCRS